MTVIARHAGRKHRFPNPEAFDLWYRNTRPTGHIAVLNLANTAGPVAVLGSPPPATPSQSPTGAGCGGDPYTTPEPAA